MGTFVTAGAALPVFVDGTPPQGLPGEFDASHVNAIWGALGDVRTHGSGFVNVMSYGATGNGSTDDTTAIQAAATAAAGKTLRFPQGSYKISGRVSLLSNTTVVADSGVTITQVTQGEIVFYGHGRSSITIRGFALVGPGSVYRPVFSADTAGAITFDTSGGGHLVEQCSVSGFYNGISATSQAGFTVRECDVTAWRIYGILASLCNDFHIDHNRVHGNDMPTNAATWSGATTYGLGDTATSGGFLWMSLQAANLNNTPPTPPATSTWWLQIATYCAMATGGRSPSGVLMSRNSVTYNEFRDNPVWDGFMSHDCDGLRIVGNDIRNVRMGLDLGTNPGALGNWIDKTIVAENYIEGTAVDAWGGAAANNRGISVSGADTGTHARNVVIADNIVNGFGTFNPGSSMQGGIVLPYTYGVSVRGNRVYGIGPNTISASLVGGIAVNADCGAVTIGGNTVLTDVGVGGGIYVLNATIADGLAIQGNTVKTGAVIPSILLSTVTGDIVAISGNALMDATTTATAIRVSGVTLNQINVSGNVAKSGASSTMYRATGSTIAREYVDWIKEVATTVLSTSNLQNQVATVTSGAGAPAVDEPIGSLYLNTSGGASTTLYVKTATGTGGWTAK